VEATSFLEEKSISTVPVNHQLCSS